MTTVKRIIPPQWDEHGVYYPSYTSPPDDSVAMCYKIPNRYIPIIFVPGIMGSNLKNTGQTPESVWLLNSTFQVLKQWGFRGASKRQQLLDPKNTTVYDGGKIPEGVRLSGYLQDKPDKKQAELRRRGWGTVSYISYGEFLMWLQNALDDCHPENEYGRHGLRASLMDPQTIPPAPDDGPWTFASPCELLTQVEKLTFDEVERSYQYQFPVYAVGYNWLQSNADSARHLGQQIDACIQYYRQQKCLCEKVILVTHSMGGLVARHCSEVLGYKDKLYGIVHGVMPAIGAAAVYKRMKAGTAGAAGWVLGPNAATMTAVLGHSPGALQLLPSPEYGADWLKIVDQDQSVGLPGRRKGVDPYGEIYTVRDQWWGLCDAKLLDPLDPNQKKLEQDWTAFSNLIKYQVKPFHLSLSDKYHMHTHAFYGDDPKHKAWGNVVWQRDRAPRQIQSPNDYPPLSIPQRIDSLESGSVADDTGTGRQTVDQRTEQGISEIDYVIRDADENGDGTVPLRSGKAPLGQPGVRTCVGFPGFEHEDAYQHEPQRKYTLWAITRIMQNVVGTQLEYKD